MTKTRTTIPFSLSGLIGFVLGAAASAAAVGQWRIMEAERDAAYRAVLYDKQIAASMSLNEGVIDVLYAKRDFLMDLDDFLYVYETEKWGESDHSQKKERLDKLERLQQEIIDRQRKLVAARTAALMILPLKLSADHGSLFERLKRIDTHDCVLQHIFVAEPTPKNFSTAKASLQDCARAHGQAFYHSVDVSAAARTYFGVEPLSGVLLESLKQRQGDTGLPDRRTNRLGLP